MKKEKENKKTEHTVRRSHKHKKVHKKTTTRWLSSLQKQYKSWKEEKRCGINEMEMG